MKKSRYSEAQIVSILKEAENAACCMDRPDLIFLSFSLVRATVDALQI